MIVSKIYSSNEVFSFTDNELSEIEHLKSRFKDDKSLILPVLWIIQRNAGWISEEAITVASKLLDINPITFYEVGTFYAMFNFDKVGKYHIKVCKSLSCALQGKDELINYIKKTYRVDINEISEDGLITLEEVECLGYCNEAPAMLINEQQYSKVTKESLKNIINNLLLGKEG